MDLIYVSYNSEKWIEKCFESVLKSEYDLKQVSIVVVDNNFTDNTVTMLEEEHQFQEAIFHTPSSSPQYAFYKQRPNRLQELLKGCCSAPLECQFRYQCHIRRSCDLS